MYREFDNENRIERREDLEAVFSDFLEIRLLRRLLNRFNLLENKMSALTDMVAEAALANTELQADVTRLTDAFAAQGSAVADLQAQVDALVAAGSATPEELAALKTALDGIQASNTALDAIAPTTTPAP